MMPRGGNVKVLSTRKERQALLPLLRSRAGLADPAGQARGALACSHWATELTSSGRADGCLYQPLSSMNL